MPTLYRLGPALLIAALTLTMVAGCGELTATPAELVAKAKEHIRHNDYSRAKIELLNALQEAPEKIEARRLLATVSLKLGESARAVSEIRKAIDLGLPREQGQLVLARALALEGDLEQLIAATRDVSGDLPPAQQAALLGIRGRALVGKGRLEKAKQTLEQALSLDEKAPEALLGMAMLHAARRQYSEARHWLEAALAVAPSSAEAWSTRGDLDLAQGKSAAAEKAFSKAIEFRGYPSLDSAKRALARAQLGKFQAAQADLDKLQKLGAGDNPFVSYVTGVNYFYQEKYNDALVAFQQSVAKAPSYLPSQIFLATVHLALGNTEQALAAAQQVYFQAPDSLAAARLLGAIQMQRSEFDAAKRVLEKALHGAPDEPAVLQTLATISLLQGETAAAVKYSERLEALDPTSDQARNTLMLAKLMNNQSLDETTAGDREPNAAGNHDYTAKFLKAAAAFRDGHLKEALERAQRLHEQYPQRADPIKLMAASHVAVGDWQTAKAELEQVLRLSPGDPSSVKNLAKVEVQLGNPQAARKLLEPLLAAHPGDAEAALLLASIDFQLGDSGRAVGVLEKALQSNPNALAVRAKLAAEYLRTGRQKKVLEITQDLRHEQLRQQPGLLELRGKAQMLSGDIRAAVSSFKHWTELSPDSAQAHYLYGDSLARSGQVDAARRELDRTLELAPNYLPARIAQIKLLALSGKPDAAQQSLEEVKKNFGEQVQVLGIEGWLALRTGDYVTAAKHFTAAREKQPSTELTLYLVQALWAAGNHDRAIEVMRAWLEENPRNIAVWLQLANAYLLSNREDEAIEAYDQVIKLYPNHVPSLNNLAWLNRESHPSKAMEYAKRAYDLAPNQPSVLDTMGVLLVRRGEAARGLSMLRSALEQAPGNVEITLHLGQALIQQKQFGEAREALKQLVASAPTSEAAAKAKHLLASIEKH